MHITKNTLTALLLASSTCTWAEGLKDITAQYLQNHSFEQETVNTLTQVKNSSDGLRGYQLDQPKNWSVTGTKVTQLLIDKNCYTDNNFGRATTTADGQWAYYLRMGWSTGNTMLSQRVTLPAGRYRLALDLRTAYANSATSSVALIAGEESSSLSFDKGNPNIFTTATWQTRTLDFVLEQASTLDLGIRINWLSGGSCVMIDNVRLYDAKDYIAPQDPTEESISSYTEGVINADFVPEQTMKTDLLKMLARFSTYLVNDYQACVAPNSIGEVCGCFKGENTMGDNEQGVRPNADLSMICAFLVKYAKPAGIALPAGVTYDKLEELARNTLVFAYSTHKANKLKVCAGNRYWGSISQRDHVWESSLWAMSVAYSAFFQWDKLSDTQKGYIYNLLKAECNYELERTIPTGYAGDTKAEENGWEANVLAATLGLFPNDPLAPKWFERMREFAINSYSHPSDARNKQVIDPWYNQQTVADLYKGANLYDDYSLQNHNLFHTSYQNVVMQELGESALALKLFQGDNEKWKSNALMHNNQAVQDSILNWLALADGELAMPNGNDWSLFLFDQITSYSTQACMQQDANALMLENMAYKYIQARQQTTQDGSWLLRPDVGARRMGVQAHRVMMTYLMHDLYSTAQLTPTHWADFNKTYAQARLIPRQNIVRAATEDRFTCFSWSDGLKSYTGYFAANSPDKNKIVVPYRAYNTGNLTGWYEVNGKGTNATPVVKGIYQLQGNGYVMNGELNTNDNTLNNRFALYSTPQNALIYLDYVTANNTATLTAEKGGMLAISTDEFMKTQRTLYYSARTATLPENIQHRQTDGSTLTTLSSDWVNIDNELGIVGKNQKQIAFGDRGMNNSIYTSKLYPMYAATSRSVNKGEVADARHLVYYSKVSAAQTQAYATKVQPLRALLPEGWNGVIAPDAGVSYLLLSNFKGASDVTLEHLTHQGYAPVFTQPTRIQDNQSSVTLHLQPNNSLGMPLRFLVQGSQVTAQLIDETSALLTAQGTTHVNVAICPQGSQTPVQQNDILIQQGQTIKVSLNDEGSITVERIKDPTVGLQSVSEAVPTPHCYDLQGRIADAAHLHKGIYIQAGKKIVK